MRSSLGKIFLKEGGELEGGHHHHHDHAHSHNHGKDKHEHKHNNHSHDHAHSHNHGHNHDKHEHHNHSHDHKDGGHDHGHSHGHAHGGHECDAHNHKVGWSPGLYSGGVVFIMMISYFIYEPSFSLNSIINHNVSTFDTHESSMVDDKQLSNQVINMGKYSDSFNIFFGFNNLPPNFNIFDNDYF